MYVYKNECAYVKNKENKTKAKDRYIEKNLKKGDGGGGGGAGGEAAILATCDKD